MAIPFWMPKGTRGPSIKSRALPTLPGRNHRLFRAVEDVKNRVLAGCDEGNLDMNIQPFEIAMVINNGLLKRIMYY